LTPLAAKPIERRYAPAGRLPTKAPHPPTGDAWLHEIKHDGFRVIARKDGNRVRLEAQELALSQRAIAGLA
jgi:ATP-dependent DNA ligase